MTNVRTVARWATGGSAGAAIVLAGVLAVAPSASAATGGSGLGDYSSGFFKGSLVEAGGVWVMCGEKNKPVPSTPLTSMGLQDAAYINQHYADAFGNHPALTDNQVAGLNAIFHLASSNAGDGEIQAAVEYASHAVEYPSTLTDMFGDAHASRDEMIAADMGITGTPGSTARVQQLTAEYIDIINSTVAAVQIDGAGELVWADASDQFTKTLTVEATEGATGVVTIPVGTFADTGTNTHEVTAGDVLTVKLPDSATSTTYDLSGTADMTVGTDGYAALLDVWLTAEGANQQSSVGLGPVVTASAFKIEGAAKATITIPVKAVALVHTGDTLVSGLTVWGSASAVLAALLAAVGVQLTRARRARAHAEAVNAAQ